MKRLRQAWRVLRGEDLGTSYPHKFVQLVYYHDNLIGLAGNGDLYKIELGYRCCDYSVSLLMQNPVRRW